MFFGQFSFFDVLVERTHNQFSFWCCPSFLLDSPSLRFRNYHKICSLTMIDKTLYFVNACNVHSPLQTFVCTVLGSIDINYKVYVIAKVHL